MSCFFKFAQLFGQRSDHRGALMEGKGAQRRSAHAACMFEHRGEIDAAQEAIAMSSPVVASRIAQRLGPRRSASGRRYSSVNSWRNPDWVWADAGARSAAEKRDGLAGT